MEILHVLMASVTAVILFVFGLENFSKEVERISGEKFRRTLAGATRLPIFGVAIGALVTALIQSSSATSVIAIGLVNAGVLSFKSSVGIIFGANVGTTVTAQLVAFKLTAFAPVIIIAGFALSLIRSRYAVFGRAIFYFGFVFFSLNLISSSLAPLRNNEAFVALLTQPQNPMLALLVGCFFTALVQSSSVTTGLAIIFTQQGLLGLENAVPLIMGANIGTTATALVAMFNMDIAAKKTAMAHFFFNVGGVLLFLPVLLLFGHRLTDWDIPPAIALANVHLVFNLGSSLFFLLLIRPFVAAIERIFGEAETSYERLKVPKHEVGIEFTEIRNELETGANSLLSFLRENYNLVSLSMESNYDSIVDAARRRIQYVQFVKREYLRYFSLVVTQVHDASQSRQLLKLINQFDYLFQIHDSIEDLYQTRNVMAEHYIEPHSDILLLTRGISNRTLTLFDELLASPSTQDRPAVLDATEEMQEHLNEAQKKLLYLLTDPSRLDAGAMTNFITYSQRLLDKLVNYSKIRVATAS